MDQITIFDETKIEPQPLPLPFFWSDASNTVRIRTLGAVLGLDLLVFVWVQAYQDMIRHARAGRTNEVGGILLGRYCQAGPHRFVLVEQNLRSHQTGNSHEFRFALEAIDRLDAIHRVEYPELIRLGWYHSHPMGLKLSDTDLSAHQRIFKQPHQLAIVMMTGGHEMGCAVWHRGKVSPVGGIFVLDGHPRVTPVTEEKAHETR